jgi:hypothetical protein
MRGRQQGIKRLKCYQDQLQQQEGQQLPWPEEQAQEGSGQQVVVEGRALW